MHIDPNDNVDIREYLTELFEQNNRPIGERTILYDVKTQPRTNKEEYSYFLIGDDSRNIGEIGLEIRKNILSSGIVEQLVNEGRPMDSIEVLVCKELYRPGSRERPDDMTKEEAKKYKLTDKTFIDPWVKSHKRMVGTDIDLTIQLGTEIYKDLQKKGYTLHGGTYGAGKMETGLCEFRGVMYLAEEMKGLGP